MRSKFRWMATLLLFPAAGCGGGDNSGSDSWTPGTFARSDSFASQCANPRTGNDPSTGRPYSDKPGSTLAENNFLRSWTHELYLWYREVPDQNPANYSTADYFNLLKTPATTPSGNPKDRFHFTYPTAQWISLSQSGVQAGYGAQWVLLSSRPPRRAVVAYTEPNSPATAPGVNLARGAEVLTVDGVDLVNASDTQSVNTLNEGLFPSAAGASHTFTVRDLGASSPRTVTMVSADVTSTPVQNVSTIRSGGGRVGYVLFNDHIATSEQLLVNAFRDLASAGVTDLVLDIRYNGGGYLDIASEVAYMIAGAGPTAGRTFERTIFNDQYTTRDPITGDPLTPVPFHSTSQGFSGPRDQPLPTVNLPRVAVLTSSSTCSASESIVNGLRGVGIQVIEVGTTTCGKPYGFYPEDNCGTTYFSIQFQGVNQQNFGDYPDGFSPANATGPVGVSLPGCFVGDDFGHDLGDPNEARLSVALGYLAGQGCPAVSVAPGAPGAAAAAPTDGLVPKSPWHQNRIYRR